MPESRKRPGHHPMKGTTDIPKSQRVKGRVIWAILFAVFAFLLFYFGVGNNYPILALVTVAGAAAGYFMGMQMEKDV